jgi:hypothetical protein
MLFREQKKTDGLMQGGPTFLFFGPRIVLLLDTRANKPLVALFFKTKFSLLCLQMFIQKSQIATLYAQI